MVITIQNNNIQINIYVNRDMTRDEIIKEIKNYFQLKELVCPHCISTYGDKSW